MAPKTIKNVLARLHHQLAALRIETPQLTARILVQDFTTGLLAQPTGRSHPCIVVPKMVPIFCYAQCQWASYGAYHS
ncbi:hypothetical protein PAMP_018385 [Pampus punctatissimus]